MKINMLLCVIHSSLQKTTYEDTIFVMRTYELT